MNRSLLSVFWILLMWVSLTPVLAQDNGWPRTLPLERGLVTVYAPQVDRMNDDIIHFRAALAYRETAGSEPVFGAGWFESRVEIDTSSRIVHPTDLKVTETRFPAGTHDVQTELSAVLAQQSPAWNLDFSLDELQASLKTTEAESKAMERLNTQPPRIIYRDHPAVLISMDGAPVLREIENSPLKAVINTPYPLIFDGRHYYLNAARDVWYRADQATGPYQFVASPPAAIAAMVKADEPEAADGQPVEAVTATNAPEIVVSTVPAELIVTDGPAAFVPLVDDLLVLQNSDNDVFMHVSSQEFFIVLAGRWYHAGSLYGPWTYRSADDLPAAFANIPRDSDQADSRVYVAGTEEARDAVLDAQVPQTAAVERGEVDIEVEYDGEPIYQPVDGTDMVYIENTGSTVLVSDGWYYLVEDGVWYVSSTPNGPWQVSTQRPAQVDTILPTSPVYNVKYVHVYDSTPSVVYVGYTPGYTGSYVYHNTIIYGSGWYYHPWVSPYYYYPRFSTWGFNVGYNPWSGWNFGLSWGWGPFSVSFYSGGYWHHSHYWYHRHYGRWGPRGYRPRYYGYRGHGYNHHGNRGYGRRDYGRQDYVSGRDGRNAYGDRRTDLRGRNDNLYRDGSQRARIADTRDRQTRTPGRLGGGNRPAHYTPASGLREPHYDRHDKGGHGRTDPVRPSDLRLKAEVRDVNFAARHDNLLADSSGKVYRKVGYPSGPYDTVGRGKRRAESTKSPVTPTPRDSRKETSRDGGRTSGRFGKKEHAKSTRKATTIASSREKQTRAAYSRARQRSSPGIKVSDRQPQPNSRNDARQPRLPAVKAPAGQSPPRARSDRANKGPPAASNAPVRQSRPGPVPKSSPNRGRNDPASGQAASPGSRQKSNSQRTGSNRGGGNRAGGHRQGRRRG